MLLRFRNSKKQQKITIESSSSLSDERPSNRKQLKKLKLCRQLMLGNKEKKPDVRNRARPTSLKADKALEDALRIRIQSKLIRCNQNKLCVKAIKNNNFEEIKAAKMN